MGVTQLDALDANGNTVTLHESDDPPEAGDINAVETAVQSQTAYSEVNVGPTLGSSFSDSYDAIRLADASTNLDIVDGQGDSTSIKAGFLETGEILPIEVQKIESTTGIASADIILLRE